MTVQRRTAKRDDTVMDCWMCRNMECPTYQRLYDDWSETVAELDADDD